ncbi:hypothetical protein [Bradyrhizobium sp.]|uniref:hypothetical protein n=1 Tax=Bradyrhizobium sp. TaxID=376 RepID=UPI003C32E6A4
MPPSDFSLTFTAPASHQQRFDQHAANAIEIELKRSKINKTNRYSAAHKGLVAVSSPAGFSCISGFRVSSGPANRLLHQERTIVRKK